MCRAKGTLLTWVQIAPSYSTAAGLCPALRCLNVNTLTSPVVPPRLCRHCRVSTGACKRACDVESVATFHARQQTWTGRCRQLWPVWLVGNVDQGYRWAHLWPWSALGYHDNVNNELIICFVDKASKIHFFHVFNGNIIVLPCLDLGCFLTPTTVTLVRVRVRVREESKCLMGYVPKCQKTFEGAWFERWGLLRSGKQFSV